MTPTSDDHSIPAGPGSIRIRQVALCTDDIWSAEQRIVTDLGVAGVHRDPPNQFGMRNTVFAVGDTFLEVLQPIEDSAPSARFLHRRGGPGGYMLIMQVDDLDATRARVDTLGIRTVFDAPPARTHRVTASAIHLHPADTGGALLSLDQMDPVDGWAWAGPAWQGHVHTDVVSGIVGVELTSADPDLLAKRFGLLVDRPVGADRTIALDGGSVAVVAGEDGTPDQLTAIDMLATDRGQVGTTHRICGTDIRLV